MRYLSESSHTWKNWKKIVLLQGIWIQNFKVHSGFSFKFLNYYRNLIIFRVILNFAQECYYFEYKVGLVDFTKARRLAKFQSQQVLVGPWALKHFWLPVLGRLQNLLLPLHVQGNHSFFLSKLYWISLEMERCRIWNLFFKWTLILTRPIRALWKW